MQTTVNLKNYSTSVPADRSIAEIEKLLAMFGASAIMKEYSGEGKVITLSFKYENNGYKLPVNTNGVYNVMYGEAKAYHARNAMKNREEQAYRVAWRLLKDWIHAQMSIVASGQATPEQIMLPYMFDGHRTLYEAYKDGKLQLTTGGQNEQKKHD